MKQGKQAWFVYVDYTSDGRPYYVGKGKTKRVQNPKRNIVHERITQKHGCQRKIELITSIEQLAFDYEIELIAEYKTQCGVIGHWGANLTSGGEGVSNPSPHVRQQMSEKRCARTVQTKHSSATRERIRAGIIKAHEEKRCGMHGRKHSSETIEKMRKAASGRRLSETAKQKVGAATRLRFQSDEFRLKHQHAVKEGMK